MFDYMKSNKFFKISPTKKPRFKQELVEKAQVREIQLDKWVLEGWRRPILNNLLFEFMNPIRITAKGVINLHRKSFRTRVCEF